ncbi:MAG: hypothetical protein ABII18_03525 [bacterium]|nr:hypothetical protein [bacterium]MBU1918185.1 hypothetical protein [bacterium]
MKKFGLILTLFTLIVLFFTFSAHAETNKLSYWAKSEIHNFSSESIYFENSCDQKKRKVNSFRSKTIKYIDKFCTVHINISSSMKKPLCTLEISDKLDVFITNKKNAIQCSARAERVPKEF